MAIIENGYNHSPSEETARRKAERLWSNADISKRYREELKIAKEVAPPSETAFLVIDNDIEAVQSVKRLDDVKKLRKKVKLLKDIVHSGRSAVTVRVPELKGAERAKMLTGYRASLAQRKRALLLEKRRRLEATQQVGG